jgi:peptide/nickel transport system substrate-binding protein
MQNRFGFKDGLFFVLLILIGVLIVVGMYGNDRVFSKLQAVDNKIGELEGAMASAQHQGAASTDVEALRAELNSIREAIASRPITVHVTGVAASGAATTPAVIEETPTTTSGPPPVVTDQPTATTENASRKDDWARPGYEIAWQKPWAFSTNPKDVPGFETGGEFTEIIGAQPPRITPYLSGDVYGRRVLDQVMEPLAGYDPETLETRGILADAWQLDPDGLWLRVHVNPSARFSDGMPVTSEDVRWTVEDFIKNERIEAERSRSTLDMIEKVDVIDGHTVEFVFNKSVFTNLDYTLGIYVLPKHFYASLEESAINQSTGLLMGSGPFRLETINPDDQWSPGEDIKIVRNARYWGAESAPLDSMRFKVIKEATAALVGYRNGDGDMMTPSSTQYDELRSNTNFLADNAIYKWVNMRSGYSFIGWQCGRRGASPDGKWTPFHDKRVRRAMTMTLNREDMIRDIWAGVGVVSTGPNSPSSPSSDPDITPWPYDLDGARALLKEAGWEDADGDGILEYQKDDEFFAKGTPFKFEFTITNSGETSERIISYLVSQCGEVGIVCVPRVVDWSFYADMLKRRDFDSMIMAWSASSPESDPRQIWHQSSIQDQGDNFIQWDNTEASDLIDKGRTTMDREERMMVWHDFHAAVHEDQPYTFLRVSPWIRMIKRDVGNVQTYPAGLSPGEFFRLPSSN